MQRVGYNVVPWPKVVTRGVLLALCQLPSVMVDELNSSSSKVPSYPIRSSSPPSPHFRLMKSLRFFPIIMARDEGTFCSWSYYTSSHFAPRENQLGVACWAALSAALEQVTSLTSLNGCDQYSAIRAGGLAEINLLEEWELGIWAARFMGRSASTLTKLDLRCESGRETGRREARVVRCNRGVGNGGSGNTCPISP
jgi:hypothetical protein